MATSRRRSSPPDSSGELAALRARLQEAEETLAAIRSGDIDALLVEGPAGEQVFTLKGAEHGYRILVETMNEGAAALDSNGTILYLNARLASFLKLALEEVIGNQIRDYLAPDQLTAFNELLHQAGARRGEFLLRTSDHRVIPVLISMSAEPPEDDSPAICMVVTDLTEQKRVLELQHTQEVLRESEDRFRTMAEAIPQLSWTCRPDGQCDYLSRQWLNYTGVPMEKQLGFAWLESLHPDDRQVSFSAWQKAFEQQADYDLEFRIRGRDGNYRWFKTRGIPMHDGDGRIIKWFGTCTDIEDIVQARQVLARSREDLEFLVSQRTSQLEETTAQLNDFCYSIAHDLRAPLRAQNAYARILLEDYGPALGDTGQGFAERIIHAAEKLDRLVQDLLSHVSISRGDLPLDRVDLASVVAQVRADFSDQIQKSQAKVALGKIGGFVMAHEPSLNLIIANLLSNALKYCKPGLAPRVTIRSESRPDQSIRLWVEDEGIGIKPEYHEKIFGVFQRLHTSDVYPGTGIGLALVRKGVGRMGGTVGVESVVGQGSQFWIELQRANQPAT